MSPARPRTNSAAARRFSSFAKRAPAAGSWADLKLPPATKTRLRAFVRPGKQPGSAARRHWALFTGPNATGKTMAAALLASDLGLKLFRVDLEKVVSKYIGETEKNLARLLDRAEAGDVLLFFDEADALFGKRSAVKDAHDRYANLETGFLLEKLEEYRGILILATNLKQNIDAAFLRRLRLAVDFPAPDDK